MSKVITKNTKKLWYCIAPIYLSKNLVQNFPVHAHLKLELWRAISFSILNLLSTSFHFISVIKCLGQNEDFGMNYFHLIDNFFYRFLALESFQDHHLSLSTLQGVSLKILYIIANDFYKTSNQLSIHPVVRRMMHNFFRHCILVNGLNKICLDNLSVKTCWYPEL